MEILSKEFLLNPDIISLIEYKARYFEKALEINSVRSEYSFVFPIIANSNRKHELSSCWSAPPFL